MLRRPPSSARTYTRLPYTTLFRSRHLVAHRPAGFFGERARSERLARNIRRYGESVTDALFAPQRQNAPVLRRKRNHPGHSRPAKADARHMAGAMDRVGDAQRPPVIILGPARRIVMDSNRDRKSTRLNSSH